MNFPRPGITAATCHLIRNVQLRQAAVYSVQFDFSDLLPRVPRVFIRFAALTCFAWEGEEFKQFSLQNILQHKLSFSCSNRRDKSSSQRIYLNPNKEKETFCNFCQQEFCSFWRLVLRTDVITIPCN